MLKLFLKNFAVILLSISLLTGNASAGVNFDGVDDFVSCGTADILKENEAIGIYIRFFYDTTPASTSYRLLHRRDSTDANGGFAININADNSLGISVGGVTEMFADTGASTLAIATEYSVVINWDGSTTAANVNFYINSTTPTAHGAEENGVLPIDTSGQTTFIGKRTGTSGFFDGTIREIAITQGRQFTASEIENLMNSRLRHIPLMFTSGVTCYLPIDDQEAGTSADADTIRDLSGNGNNGTGDDGDGNSGLLWVGESILSYPSGIIGQ